MPENSRRPSEANKEAVEKQEGEDRAPDRSPKASKRRKTRTRGVAGLLGDYTQDQSPTNPADESDTRYAGSDPVIPEHERLPEEIRQPPEDPTHPAGAREPGDLGATTRDASSESQPAGRPSAPEPSPKGTEEGGEESVPKDDNGRWSRPDNSSEEFSSEESDVVGSRMPTRRTGKPVEAPVNDAPVKPVRRPSNTAATKSSVARRSRTGAAIPPGESSPLGRGSGEPVVKVSYYLPEGHTFVIDEMRAQLKRRYRYTARQASQSNIISLAIELLYEELMGEPFPEAGDEQG